MRSDAGDSHEPAATSSPVPDPRQSDARSASGGARWAAYVAAVRAVQDLVAGTAPPEHVLADATARLEAVVAELDPYQVADESDLLAGMFPDLPGRGGTLFPPYVTDETFENGWRGRVTLTEFYRGGGGAAHGGTIPLLFDEVLGILPNRLSPVRCRTAYLHVNYRNITPIGRELTWDATVDRVEGRKWFASARLNDGEITCADAEGLFVALRPGRH